MLSCPSVEARTVRTKTQATMSVTIVPIVAVFLSMTATTTVFVAALNLSPPLLSGYNWQQNSAFIHFPSLVPEPMKWSTKRKEYYAQGSFTTGVRLTTTSLNLWNKKKTCDDENRNDDTTNKKCNGKKSLNDIIVGWFINRTKPNTIAYCKTSRSAKKNSIDNSTSNRQPNKATRMNMNKKKHR